MSQHHMYIVPKHKKDYPNAEQKMQQVLAWFQQQGYIGTELKKEPFFYDGYPFTSKIGEIFCEDQYYIAGYSCFNIHCGERIVFHPLENAELRLTCIHCGATFEEDVTFDWVGEVYEGKESCECLECGKSEHFYDYIMDEGAANWAFSNVGLYFYGATGFLNDDFLEQMKTLFGMDVIVVYVHA